MGLSLPAFLATLNNYRERIPLDELVKHMQQLELNADEYEHCVRFDPEHYTRNLLSQGPAYQALILCWLPGQESVIHDHVGSSCGVKVLSGTCTEVFFERREDRSLRARQPKDLHEGQICGAQDDNIHKICNFDQQRSLLTLHIYSPPLTIMNTYNEDGEYIGEALVQT
jgi:cysteine dioxygenase